MSKVRPLVVRFGALGDMVILTTLIRHLYARFGEPVDIVSSGSWTRPLLETQPSVGRLYLLKSRRWPYHFSREQQRLVRELRARGPSATWLCDVDNGKVTRLLRWAGWRANHYCDYQGLTDLPGLNQCDLFLRFAYRNPGVLGGEDLPLTAGDAYGAITVTTEQRADLVEWLAIHGLNDTPLLLVQVGNKRTMRRGARDRASNSKYWPEEHWAAVLRGLRERHPDCAILLLGVPRESALNQDVLKLAAIPNGFDVANELPIGRLLALVERAEGMVSVDTGPAHVAAALNCPVVTLFGKMSTDLYAPRSAKARVECVTGRVNGEASMLGITPQAVLEAWDRQRIGADLLSVDRLAADVAAVRTQ